MMTPKDAIRFAITETLRQLESPEARSSGKSAELRLTELVRTGGAEAARAFVNGLEHQAERSLVAARLVATGSAWVGAPVGSVETALLELVGSARREICMTVYSFGTAIHDMLDRLEERMSTGVRVIFVANDISGQPAAVQAWLSVMSARFPHCTVRDFCGVPGTPGVSSALHAKVTVVDRRRALLGSANLSQAGLVGNHELALRVEGVVAEQIADLIQLLATR